MSHVVAEIQIPDSTLAKAAAELLREHGNDLLWNHSHRVYLFGALMGKRNNVKYDLELLYISALFHDLGLTKHYSSPDKRFEVDGANAARDFLRSYGVPEESARLVWDAVALHTTIGIAQYKEPEVALINSGVSYDVVGENFDAFTEDVRNQVTLAYPRNGFKNKILPAFLEGFAHKPETTYGNIKADVCARLLPGFKRKDFCDSVLHSPWHE
ncbi:HD domain-containing protein [Paenibacillus sp. FSL H8-0457]|uniref:HD domain-containing protein n=1 Tax=Bacillales TaxID=1385 RepID=UPI000178826C|nr:MULTISPECIES: HD domain-containing protein [unclassified Paenibacillus]ACX67502.1 metal dependent phosphohydrolase [Paenibacillus sp. Y412MC10]ETT58793.1 metal dependent phosphohydrolase [Paenibacillus sp. FSL H8-457]